MSTETKMYLLTQADILEIVRMTMERTGKDIEHIVTHDCTDEDIAQLSRDSSQQLLLDILVFLKRNKPTI